MFHSKPHFYFLVLFLLSIHHLTQAQSFTRRNSPYSRYGIGDLYPKGFVPLTNTGGGLNATYSSFFDVNLVNPASLGKLTFTSMEVGTFYKYSRLREQSTGLRAEANDGNLSYLSFSVPVTRSWEIERDSLKRGVPIQWGISFSLLPHSTVAYDVSVTQTVAELGEEIQYEYKGRGTRFRINWGNGFRYKRFSAGFNLGILFGRTSYNNTLTFTDKEDSFLYGFDTEYTSLEDAKGFLWDFGVQYEHEFGPDGKGKRANADKKGAYKLVIGAYGTSGANVKLSTTNRYRRYGLYYTLDTVSIREEENGSMSLPVELGAGISFGQNNRWRLGLNYETQLWGGFSKTTASAPLKNTNLFALGFQWSPKLDMENYRNYINKIIYRWGAYYGSDPRTIRNTELHQLSKYGMTFGFGLPVKTKDSQAFINIGLEYGYLGHHTAIEEHFFKVNLGFTLNEKNWFIRSKFR